MAEVDLDRYVLLRDGSEAERLELQHRCYMQSQGYHIHPDVTLPAKPRVAELATGTAIWLREVREMDPSAECHGFDISDAMFPEHVDPGVELHLHDAKRAFDARWHAYFDLVHVRFIQFAMSAGDWPLVLGNLLAILKPGGWIQWAEIDGVAVGRNMPRASQPDPSGQPPYYNKSRTAYVPPKLNAWRKAFRAFFPWGLEVGASYGYLNLERLFEDPQVGNLDNVYTDACGAIESPELRRDVIFQVTIAMKGMIEKANKAGNHDMDPKQWEKEALEEIKNGAYAPWVQAVFIGQKKKQ